MPIIIGNNNNQGNEIADAAARLADNLWGKGAMQSQLLGAQTLAEQQRAYGLSDENKRRAAIQADPYGAAALAAAAALGKGGVDGVTAARLANAAANPNSSPTDLTRAGLAAGQPMRDTVGGFTMEQGTTRRGQDLTYKSTTRGQDVNAQTQRDVAGIQGTNQLNLERAKQDAEPINVIDENGRTVVVSRADAIRRGLQPIMSKDQVVGGMIQGYNARRNSPPTMPSQQGTTTAPLKGPSFDINGPLSPPSTMAAPNGRDLTTTVDRPQPPVLQPNLMLGPDAPLGIQEAVGERATNIPMLETGGMRRQGVSRDGGQTVTLGDGTTVPAQGFLPAGPESAIAQGRLGNIVQSDQTWMQKNPQASPEKSGAMKAILALGGPQQLGVNEINRALGATGLSKVITPLVGQDIAAAQTNLNVWNEQMIRGLGVSSDPGQKEQRRIYENLLPGDSFLNNPAVEAMKIPALANALVQRNEVLHRQLASVADPSSPMLGKLQQDIAENEKALDMLTNPNWGSQPFDVATSPGNALEAQAGRAGNNPDGTPRQAMPTATGPNGQKVQWNGQQWVPMNGR